MIEKFRNARVIREFWKPVTITVHHGKPLEELILAGGYSHIDQDINSDHFRISMGTEDTIKKVDFFRFDHRRLNQIFRRFVAIKKILEKMRRDKARGYMPIGIEELLVIGEKFPQLNPLIALGAIWKYSISNVIVTPQGKRADVPIAVTAVPCIFEVDGRRELGLKRFFGSLDVQKLETDWRFGAVDNFKPVD